MSFSNTSRIEFIDFIKGLAIFVVIWGHCIQNFGARDGSFFDNPVHILICSFHMPIFMVVSGYFFCKSLKLNLGQLIIQKGRQLVLPMFSWSVIVTLLGTIHQIIGQGLSSISIPAQIHEILFGTATNFWFIRSVFICYIITAISKYFIKQDGWACMVSILIFLALPDNFRLALDKFMLPFFWMGYFMHKYQELLDRHKKSIFLFAFILWIVLLFFWEKKYYIYITGCAFYTLENGQFIAEEFFSRFSIVLFRYMIGLAGCCVFFFTAQAIYRSWLHPIAYVGQKTLGIYIIHIILMSQLIPYIQWPQASFGLLSFVLAPGLAVLLLLVSLTITRLLEFNKYTRTIFLGNRLTSISL